MRIFPLLRSQRYCRFAAWQASLLVLASMMLCGCTSISIEPSCPNELVVGGSGRVTANEINPGGIATYLWEVFPPDAGSFQNQTQPTTTFQATKTGEVLIRLTASDGIFQVVSACVTTVIDSNTTMPPANVAVSLTADPIEAAVDDPITITCTSAGPSIATGLTIEQIDGAAGTLTELMAGISEFRATAAGQATFSCVGVDINAEQSELATVTVTVTTDGGGGGGRR